MKKAKWIFLIALTIMTFGGCRKTEIAKVNTPTPRLSQPTNSNCQLNYEGSDREEVKLRPVGLHYPDANDGKPFSVKEWFAFLCSEKYNTGLFPLRAEFFKEGTRDIEELSVSIRAKLLALKKDGDNDYHLQVADGDEWSMENPQVIIEIPPGAEYCEARLALERIYSADNRGKKMPGVYYFKNPPLVEARGYLFLDAHHWPKQATNICEVDGGRGIKGNVRAVGVKFDHSPVQGLWEIHPVLELKSAK